MKKKKVMKNLVFDIPVECRNRFFSKNKNIYSSQTFCMSASMPVYWGVEPFSLLGN